MNSFLRTSDSINLAGEFAGEPLTVSPELGPQAIGHTVCLPTLLLKLAQPVVDPLELLLSLRGDVFQRGRLWD